MWLLYDITDRLLFVCGYTLYLIYILRYFVVLSSERLKFEVPTHDLFEYILCTIKLTMLELYV